MPNSEYLLENETMVMLSYFFIFLHIGSKTNIGKKNKNRKQHLFCQLLSDLLKPHYTAVK